MPDPLPQSILCPILIGRDAQVAALTRLLDQARTGQGQIALISGEAGIGKSRLVAEIKKLATAQGMSVVQGNCFEPDRMLPYAPLLDLLRTVPKESTCPRSWLPWWVDNALRSRKIPNSVSVAALPPLNASCWRSLANS